VSIVTAAAAPTDLVGHSIVIVGTFDPSRMQPGELVKNGLFDEADLSGLTYSMILQDIVVGSLPWISFTVEREKLTATTTLTSPAAEPVRDFVLDLIELMPARQYSALGINRDTHLPLHSKDDLQALLDRLAAKMIRSSVPIDDDARLSLGAPHDARPNQWLEILVQPVLRTLSVQGNRDDGTSGSVTVRVEPSIRVLPAVYVQINDHFEANPATLTPYTSARLRRASFGICFVRPHSGDFRTRKAYGLVDDYIPCRRPAPLRGLLRRGRGRGFYGAAGQRSNN
jgi:hypothetical protein